MAEKNVAIRLAAVGGKAVKDQFVEIGREGSRAFREIEQSSRGGASGLQNVGYQVQDFAVQVAGGTDASRALAQQLPQLLSGFGLFGVLLGTATAVLVPLIGYLWDSGAAVDDLDKQMSELEKSTKAYHAAAQNAAIPIDDLTRRFGGQAGAVRDLYDAQLALSRLDLVGKEQALNDSLVSQFSGLSELIAKITEAQNYPLLETSVGAQAELSANIARLRDEFSMTIDQARVFQAAMDQLDNAKGPVEAAAAMAAVRQAILDAEGGYENLTEEQVKLLQGLSDAQAAAVLFGATDMSGGLRGANAEAQTLVERVNAALDRAAQAAAFLAPGREVRGLDDDRGSQRATNIGATNHFTGDQPWLDKPNRRGGGAQKEQNQLMNEAKKLYDQTRTSAEKYEIEIKRLDDLLSKGVITQDTYNRAVDDLKHKLGGVGDAAKKMKDEIGAALEDIVLKGGDANEVISNLLASFASSLFKSGFDSLIGNLFPTLTNAKGNAFEGGNVIPFANGGIVSGPTMFGMRGGLGLMGEAGPEAIMPLRRGADGKLGVAAAPGGGSGGVTVQVTVNAQGAVDGVAKQVNDAVQRHIPSIVKQAVAGVGAAKNRGYRV